VPPNANPAVSILIRVKAANVTAGIGQACITSYCKTRILNAKCLTPIRKYHTGQSEVEHRLAFRNNLHIASIIADNDDIVSKQTDEVEEVGEEGQESVVLSVVDGDAQELGVVDERRLRTRGTHVHHVLDTVLLHTHTHTHTARCDLTLPLLHQLATVLCSATVTDSNTVLYEAKDISVYSSLWDITIAPP